MPELPEVETVRLGMERSIRFKAFKSVDIRRHDLRRIVPKNFEHFLSGKIVKSLTRRGKYIVFEFENEPGAVAVLHLGMSGRIHIYPSGAAGTYVRRKHDHIIMDMDDGTRLVYEDPRRFGLFYPEEVSGVQGGWENIPPFDVMGPEPLEDAWDGRSLCYALKGKSAPVKTLLLDQKIVAGLGNIYVCEALHEAGINPELRGKELDIAKCQVLTEAIKSVLRRAIAAGGSTLRDYRKTDGSLGYFQHNFRVYNRQGAACPTEGCAGKIARISQGGRSTFYCPVCQK